MRSDKTATFQPDRVTIEAADGTVLEELLHPGSSLQGQTLQSTWNTAARRLRWLCYLELHDGAVLSRDARLRGGRN